MPQTLACTEAGTKRRGERPVGTSNLNQEDKA